MWQDFAIAITDVFLSYALVPQVIHNFKNKHSDVTFQTSIIGTVGLYFLVYVVYTLGLIFASIITGVAATLWLILLIQGLIYKKPDKNSKKEK